MKMGDKRNNLRKHTVKECTKQRERENERERERESQSDNAQGRSPKEIEREISFHTPKVGGVCPSGVIMNVSMAVRRGKTMCGHSLSRTPPFSFSTPKL